MNALRLLILLPLLACNKPVETEVAVPVVAPEVVEVVEAPVEQVPAEATIEGWTRTLAPPAPDTTSPDRRTLVALAGCTRRACPDNTCCNTCHSGGWGAPDSGMKSLQEDLPVCEVDGCGKCTYDLEVLGYATDDSTYVVLEWNKVDAAEGGAGTRGE